MRSLDRIRRRRLLLLLVASLPFAAGLRDSCGTIPTFQSITGVKGAEGLDYAELRARAGQPPNQTTAQATCDNTGAGGASPCPNLGTPAATSASGASRGTNVDARVSTVSGAQGIRVDWSISEHPDGSGEPPDLVGAQLEAITRYGSRFFRDVTSAQNAIEVTAYDVKWGGVGTVLRDCDVSVRVDGGAAVVVPTDGTPTLVSYDASGSSSGVPVEYAVSCVVDLLDDCSTAPPGTPCQLATPPFDVAGHLAVEVRAPARSCRSDAQCDVTARYCVNGTCRDGEDGTRCANALDCDPGLFCSVSTGRCVDGGPGDACADDLDCPNATGCAFLSCQAGDEGSYCDADGDCNASAPFCLQPPGQFIGFCGRGALRSACADDSDCGLSLDCLGPIFNPTCLQCTSAADCTNGSVCLAGVCTLDAPEPCSTSLDCSGGEICQFQGLGRPQLCQFDCFLTHPCRGPGEQCAGDRCLECLADTDCGPGRSCLVERCVP